MEAMTSRSVLSYLSLLFGPKITSKPDVYFLDFLLEHTNQRTD